MAMSNGRKFAIGAVVGYILIMLVSAIVGDGPKDGADASLQIMALTGCLTVAVFGDMRQPPK